MGGEGKVFWGCGAEGCLGGVGRVQGGGAG